MFDSLAVAKVNKPRAGFLVALASASLQCRNLSILSFNVYFRPRTSSTVVTEHKAGSLSRMQTIHCLSNHRILEVVSANMTSKLGSLVMSINK